jgi:hypothetical protein
MADPFATPLLTAAAYHATQAAGQAASHAASNAGAALHGMVNSGSLSEFTSSTRVGVRVLMEEALRGASYSNDLLHTACSIYSSYYLRAVSLVTSVSGVAVLEVLDRLNPDRNPVAAAVRMKRRLSTESELLVGTGSLNMESFGLGLPTAATASFSAEGSRINPLTNQWEDDGKGAASTVKTDDGKDKKPTRVEPGQKYKDAVVTINENNNLGVGKILEVTISQNGQSATIPVMITMMVGTADQDSVVHILSLHNLQYTFKERWHGFRSGEKKFWRDVVFMQDIVDKHTKVLANDKSGFYADQLARSGAGVKTSAITGEPSLATSSAVIMFTKETAKRAEIEIGSPIDNASTRMHVFKATMSMLMFIVDTEYEMVTVYHRGFDVPTTLHLRELKGASKGGGPDIAEVLKAYQLGKAPSSF